MKYWEDYQSKWGFGDGDAVPPDAALLRQVYCRELNRELQKRKSTVRLLAWDRPGVHNPLLILRVSAHQVRGVPERRLWLGQWDGGWQPEGEWQEPDADEVFDQVIADAYSMELDDRVETTVSLKA
jgi:hypothetical protein